MWVCTIFLYESQIALSAAAGISASEATPAAKRAWVSSCSNSSPSRPSTMRPYMLMNRRYESYAKRSSLALARPTTVLSFKPKLRTVSIMPGIENFAPERTDTNSGSATLPSLRPIFFSSAATCFAISRSRPFGHPPFMYSRHASVVTVNP